MEATFGLGRILNNSLHLKDRWPAYLRSLELVRADRLARPMRCKTFCVGAWEGFESYRPCRGAYQLPCQCQERFESWASRLSEMSIAVTSPSAPHRVVADEPSRNRKMGLKLVWQVSGSGKGVNTLLKELVTGIGQVLGQMDSQLATSSKTLEEHGKHLSAVENLVKIYSTLLCTMLQSLL